MREGLADDNEIRAAWEELRGEPVSDDLWTLAKGAHYGDADFLPCAADAMDEARQIEASVSALAGGSAPLYEAEPPKSWVRFCKEEQGRFRDYQLRAQGAMGLSAPVRREAIHDLLRLHAERQGQPQGVDLYLSPTIRYYHYPQTEPGEDPEKGRLSLGVRAVRGQPLYELDRYSQYIVAAAVTSAEAAVEYLLADAPLTLPWIRVTPMWDAVPDHGAYERLTLTIGTLEVTPEEVAAAYATARRQYIRALETSAMPRSRYKRAAEDHTDLIEYMDARIRAGQSRRDAARAWLAEHHEDTRRMDSICKTYQRYRGAS